MWHKFIQPHSTIGRDTKNNNNNNKRKKERKKKESNISLYTHTLCRSNLIWLK